jgi:DNA-binding transcriptional regulator PaaX
VKKIEQKEEKGNPKKLIPVSEVILVTLAGTALISLAAVAPGVIYALKKLGVAKKLLDRQKYYINDSLERLVKKDLVSIVDKNGEKFVKLTKAGNKSLFKIQAKQEIISIPKKWDYKYRVVIFDIKESEKSAREEIRYTLLQCGFVKLQNSVWVYPYPCEGIIHLLRTHLEVEEENLVYMTVESIENDEWLRKHFKLPLK